jgi:hypothetical protein
MMLLVSLCRIRLLPEASPYPHSDVRVNPTPYAEPHRERVDVDHHAELRLPSSLGEELAAESGQVTAAAHVGPHSTATRV